MEVTKTTFIQLCLAALFLLPLDGNLYAQGNPDSIIEDKCNADWPDNYRMRAACIEQQEKVLEKSRLTPIDPRLALEDLSLIRETCAKDWPDDFRSRAKCEQQQMRGFEKLQAPPPKGVTLKDYSVAIAQCSQEWPDDFRMRAHCLERQLAAARRHPELNGAVDLK